MLEGTVSDAERRAREAIRLARACDPPARTWELHATTTLGVSLGWRADPEAAVAMLGEARRMAEELGDLDELFRVYANLTTVLDLAGRNEEAVTVASEGIEAALGRLEAACATSCGAMPPTRCSCWAAGGGLGAEHDRGVAAGGQIPEHAGRACHGRDRAVRRRGRGHCRARRC
jgi:hypothetical protein